MIKNFDQFVNENISTPHDFGDDIVELKQKNIKLLSQEVIDGNLKLDSSFMDVDAKFVKLKIVNGDIFLTGGQWAEIPEWLKEVEIRGGGFYCINNKLTSLKNCPQKIGTSFNCEHNKLKNLKGCPKKIGGNFICSFNKLMTSLEGCPEFVGGSFICSYNDLVSLLGCPEFIGGDFRCDNNYSFLRLPDYVKIGGKFINKFINENLLVPRNLEGRKEKLKQMNIKLLSQEVIDGDLKLDESFMDIDPKFVKLKKVNGNVLLTEGQWTEIPAWLNDVEISGTFDCSRNKLTTLKNCPQKIGRNLDFTHNNLKTLKNCPQNIIGYFSCADNQLMSLEGGPKNVGLIFYCTSNHLTSLEGCPENVEGNFWCEYNKVKLELPDYVKLKGNFYNSLSS